jgi:hypothetical protein
MTQPQPQTQPQRTDRRLAWPRWLLGALALACSALCVATSDGGFPTWLTVLPAVYLTFISTGAVVCLCLTLRLRGLPLVLTIVAVSVAVTVLVGVGLDLVSIKISGRSLAIGEFLVQLVVGGAALCRTWWGRNLAFWEESLGTEVGADAPVGLRFWLRGAMGVVAAAGLVVALIVAARSQHRQVGTAYSSFAFAKDDPALGGELPAKRSQVLKVGLELDTVGAAAQAVVQSTLANAVGPSAILAPGGAGRFSGDLLVTVPARAGRYELVITTVNPTHVAQAPVWNPGTVSGRTAEEVNSAARLQLTVWLDVS